MNKMKILARKIYDSTPGINDGKFNFDFDLSSFIVCPKKKSKILADVDEESEERALRARNFVHKCD